MTNSAIKFRSLALAAATTLALAACSKSSSDEAANPGMSKLQVQLVDAPGDYRAVNLDVRELRAKVSEDESEDGWQSLPLARPGIYNVLDYVNGNAAILTDASFPAGRVSQLRVVLGPNNSLVLRDGTTVALSTPSAQQSGLKLKINADLVKDVTYQLVLDFDVDKSIVRRGNSGQYNLKPTIRTYAVAVAGAIRGSVTPAAARPQVLAIRTSATPNDTLSTTTDATGGFLLRGVPAGIYRVEILASTPYSNATINPLVVSNNQVRDLGNIRL